MKRLRQGQDLVEFAIITPILLLFIFAIFDLGRGVIAYSTLQNGAREGARYGAVHLNDTAGVEDAIRRRVMALNQADLAVSYAGWCYAQNDFDSAVVRVCTTYAFQPILGNLFGTNLMLRSRSTMRMEQFPEEFSPQPSPSCPAIPVGCQ